jgi:hypothetical protein
VRHHVPWAPPPVNEAVAASYDSVASPTPHLDLVEAQPSPCCAAVPRTSPERAPPRPPPPGAVGQARQRHPRPVSDLKPMHGEFVVTSPPFPRPIPVPDHRNLGRCRLPPWPGATLQGVESFQGPHRKTSTSIVYPLCGNL